MTSTIKYLKSKIFKLPKSPGVYEFRNIKGEILYIGKATDLRNRVSSYFLRNACRDRLHIESMISEIADIKIHKTDSVLEALILEANLIKKYQPKYNLREKDDKSFGYFVITKEEFPRVVAVFKTQLGRYAAKSVYGPYVSKRQMEIALKVIRRIFPFHSIKDRSEKYCLDFQLGKCPGPYVGAISKEDYAKNIHGIERILQGKRKRLLVELERLMREYSKNNEFEKAAETRNRIFALKHIQDMALISNCESFASQTETNLPIRIEAYDISNIGGDFATGSMVVFAGRKPNKDQYRKFKVLTVKSVDDIGMMREVLIRRFQNDWPLPDLIIVDGGKGHINMAENVIAKFGYDIPVAGVAKGPTRKKVNVYYNKEAQIFHDVIGDKRLMERIRNEAHRFAISYHKKLRRKSWKDK